MALKTFYVLRTHTSHFKTSPWTPYPYVPPLTWHLYLDCKINLSKTEVLISPQPICPISIMTAPLTQLVTRYLGAMLARSVPWKFWPHPLLQPPFTTLPLTHCVPATLGFLQILKYFTSLSLETTAILFLQPGMLLNLPTSKLIITNPSISH